MYGGLCYVLITHCHPKSRVKSNFILGASVSPAAGYLAHWNRCSKTDEYERMEMVTTLTDERFWACSVNRKMQTSNQNEARPSG